MSILLDKPLVGVNHLEGHIAANYLTYKELKPPFICLLISGGNTMIIEVKDYTKFKVLGKTKDDAIGEAFDKVARVLDLPYPGGPKIDELAKQGKNLIEFPKTKVEGLDFSFSGIKTAVINYNHNVKNVNKADLAYSFEKYVSEYLVEQLTKTFEKTNIRKLVIGGGVSANSFIRKELSDFSNKNNIQIYYPDLKICTDNAAMIASAGYYSYLQNAKSNLSINAIPNLKIEDNE